MHGALTSKSLKPVAGVSCGKNNTEDVIRLDLDLPGRFRVIRKVLLRQWLPHHGMGSGVGEEQERRWGKNRGRERELEGRGAGRERKRKKSRMEKRKWEKRDVERQEDKIEEKTPSRKETSLVDSLSLRLPIQTVDSKKLDFTRLS